MISKKIIITLCALVIASQTVEAMHKAPDRIKIIFESETKNHTQVQDDQNIPVLLDHVLKGHTGMIMSLASFEKDGVNYIVSGSDDMTVRVWDLEKHECVCVLEGHTGSVWSLCVDDIRHDQDVLIISGSVDCDIRVWSFNKRECVATLGGHLKRVSDLKINSPMSPLYSCSWDKTVKQWDLNTFECKHTMKTDGDVLQGLGTLADSYVAATDWDGNIFILDFDNQECMRQLKVKEQELVFLKALPESRLLMWNGGCSVWNWQTGENYYSFKDNGPIKWGIQAMQSKSYEENVVLLKINGLLYNYLPVYPGELQGEMNVGIYGTQCLTIISGKLVYSTLADCNIYVSPYQY